MTELPPLDPVASWPAGTSTFPTQVDVFESLTDGDVAKQINDAYAAIAKIEATLGALPAGSAPTIKAALIALNATVANLQSQLGDLQAVPGPVNSFYRFVQTSPASTWVVTHPLGRRPAVTVVDSAGSPVEGDVDYPDTSTVRITFSAPFAGEALLS